jgi:glycosyltransferase involved in cell wall biosynthesis
MLDLTIVVIAYNEEATLKSVVVRSVEVAAALGITSEVIVVDDASTDATASIAAALAVAQPTVRHLRHRLNQGSGMAIRSGIAAARGERIIYVPADGQFDVTEIGRFLEAAERADVVLGARESRSDYTWFRLLSSRTFLVMVRSLFGTDVEDVNWVHLWHRRVFAHCAVRSRGVFLLEEILVRAQRAGLTVAEVDSAYRPRKGGQATGGNPRTILKTMAEMAALRAELWLRR